MPPKFLEGFNSKLAEQWVATLLTPAFLFWLAGLLAYCDRYGLFTIQTWFKQYSEPIQIGILAVILCFIAASGFIAQRFDTEILRALEGYWYPGLRRLLIPCTQFQKIRHRRLITILKRINPKLLNHTATLWERTEFSRCDRLLHQFPEKDHDFLPTRLGNILRAAERRPYHRYGLDAIICWPRLWLILPEATKKDIQTAQSELNNAVRLCLWGVLGLGWGIWSWKIISIALLSFLFAYNWAITAAITYGELIEASFDLHRKLLYQALGWKKPDDPKEERRVGQQLTNYLWRGF